MNQRLYFLGSVWSLGLCFFHLLCRINRRKAPLTSAIRPQFRNTRDATGTFICALPRFCAKCHILRAPASMHVSNYIHLVMHLSSFLTPHKSGKDVATPSTTIFTFYTTCGDNFCKWHSLNGPFKHYPLSSIVFTTVDWRVSPRKKCTIPNLQYLWIWLICKKDAI